MVQLQMLMVILLFWMCLSVFTIFALTLLVMAMSFSRCSYHHWIKPPRIIPSKKQPLKDRLWWLPRKSRWLKYTTQSVSLVTSEDLENIPVRGFNQVIATQNSVVVQDGNIHIRWRSWWRSRFYIDGASSITPYQYPILYIIQEAVEEFQVLAGGYTVEFGGANAGIVHAELKPVAKTWNFRLISDR